MTGNPPRRNDKAESMVLKPRTFNEFCELIYAKSGIRLGPKKEALVAARMGKRIRALGLPSYEAYLEVVKRDDAEQELVEMLNAISTNVTHFFREERHFEILSSLLCDWQQKGQSEYRIWSAACSTGEEPYSIAMTAQAALSDLQGFKILATDLSTGVLDQARHGRYEQRHLEKVPQSYVRRFFSLDRDNPNRPYAVTDEQKRMVTFARLNLAKPPFPMKGNFDVVFCRNVMIYFDNEIRRALLSEIERLLKPGGYLMVGHAESLSGMLSSFRSVEPSVYVK